jgi:hypothetical protein
VRPASTTEKFLVLERIAVCMHSEDVIGSFCLSLVGLLLITTGIYSTESVKSYWNKQNSVLKMRVIIQWFPTKLLSCVNLDVSEPSKFLSQINLCTDNI